MIILFPFVLVRPVCSCSTLSASNSTRVVRCVLPTIAFTVASPPVFSARTVRPPGIHRPAHSSSGIHRCSPERPSSMRSSFSAILGQTIWCIQHVQRCSIDVLPFAPSIRLLHQAFVLLTNVDTDFICVRDSIVSAVQLSLALHRPRTTWRRTRRSSSRR